MYLQLENVLSGLSELLDEFGSVTLEEYYKLCGFINTTYDDRKYGWLDVRDAIIFRTQGGYMIQLPPLTSLNNIKPESISNYHGMDIDGDKMIELKVRNEDTVVGPFTICPKGVLQKTYINIIGEEIDYLGSKKTVNSVKITKEYIIVELY